MLFMLFIHFVSCLCILFVVYVFCLCSLEENGEDVVSPKKRSYSVEDITAALDDMIEENELLKETTQAKFDGGARAAPAAPASGDEFDVLGQALKGFPPKQSGQQQLEMCVQIERGCVLGVHHLNFFSCRGGEPDELLADIDDMLADLNTELDFMIPDGTDV